MITSNGLHCQYCMCPKEIWKPSLETYKGDECKLCSDFFDIIQNLEEGTRYNINDVLRERSYIIRQYPDISNFEATVKELLKIGLDTGIMSKKYSKLMVVPSCLP